MILMNSGVCKSSGDHVAAASWMVTSKICQLKKQIQTARTASIKVFKTEMNSNTGAMVPVLSPFATLNKEFIGLGFPHRNQRMTDDQSVLGRRQIYYDQYGSEALICSDSEEEVPEPGEEKHDFSEGEDQILWKVLQEHGLNLEVLNTLSQFIDANALEIQERYDVLRAKYQESRDSEGSSQMGSERNIFLDKSLSAALDSFDNLFCRRCLGKEDVKDVLRNNSQASTMCGKDVKDSNATDDSIIRTASELSCTDEKISATISSQDADVGRTAEIIHESLDGDANAQVELSAENVGKRKFLMLGNMSIEENEPGDEDILASVVKKHKKVMALHHNDDYNAEDRADNMDEDKANDEIEVSTVEKPPESSKNQVEVSIGGRVWSRMEKELYLKGIEIFGRNSCLIARNLLSGLKTCIEVANYMLDDQAAFCNRSTTSPNSLLEDNGKGDQDFVACLEYLL
ncbi:hypothetical protein ACLOJK_017633 [Asimina triloba]